MKPSDLNPLFSDEDATPQEIARAKRIVASLQLKEIVAERRRLQDNLDYKTEGFAYTQAWKRIEEIDKEIIALVLELFPESE
jgi:hypothetical protein